MRGDAQPQSEEIQDSAAHLKHLQSIIFKFDADCTPDKGQLSRTFYNGLRPPIKLWIDEIGGQQMSWDDLVSVANRAKAKARIHNNDHLDQWCPKGKCPLKMNVYFRDEQQPKTAAPSQVKINYPPAGQSEASEKAQNEKTRKRQGK